MTHRGSELLSVAKDQWDVRLCVGLKVFSERKRESGEGERGFK